MTEVVGTYSVSIKSLFENWKKKDWKPKEIQKKGKKTLKPILHPIFEACSNLTDDTFWQSIFMDCARGKFPRGFTFKNNLITYKKGNKYNRLEISNSASEVFSSTMDFFSNNGGIMSQQDQKRMQQLEEEKLLENLNENENLSWKDVKSEKMKEILITDFISDVSENMEFDEEEKKEFKTTVKKGFMLKYFTASNIYMENGKIVEIDGLIFNKQTKNYEIDSEYITKRPGRRITGLGIEKYEKRAEIDFLEIWEKYLENLENKRNKKTSSYSYSHINNEEESEE